MGVFLTTRCRQLFLIVFLYVTPQGCLVVILEVAAFQRAEVRDFLMGVHTMFLDVHVERASGGEPRLTP